MKCGSGSTLLLILCVIFILLAAAMKCWKISSARFDIQMQRELYYKRFYLTENTFKDVLQQAINGFDQFLKTQTAVKVDLSDKIKGCGYSAFGQIDSIRVKKKVKTDTLIISAFLLEGQDTVFTLRCHLTKKRILNKTKMSYVVSGFTIF